MLNNYIPIVSGLLSLFIVVLLYDFIQSLLKRESSSMNNQLAIALNILVVISVFVLIGTALYFALAAIFSAINSDSIFNIQF
jgi:hypothetical protein